MFIKPPSWILLLQCFRRGNNNKWNKNTAAIRYRRCYCVSSQPNNLSLRQQRDFLRAVWSSYVQPGDTCIDATCGKGRDSLQMAKLIGPQGFLLACDIQSCAVEQTEALLRSELDASQCPQIKMVCASHELLSEYVKDNSVRLISYNLGYLPNGDRNIRTTAQTTRNSLERLLPKLCCSGIISLVCYVGHSGGFEERNEILKYVATLPKNLWCVTFHEWINRSLAPSIVLIEKQPH
ncbi:hypothetical protein GAYE_PCTG60G1360 [Galdieria yellowstonensis]|uniref:rRNA methylase n=1 Tax=Galdieria yellowstonensis TaxID=3028027 RepID=A0AAV9I4J8_9RHOD|nr:hypothetical protein GAYE_PCTG60G1360 [Galdieria yellowstonensis]